MEVMWHSLTWKRWMQKGRRCPTDEDRIDFTVSGQLHGVEGFNAAKLNAM